MLGEHQQSVGKSSETAHTSTVHGHLREVVNDIHAMFTNVSSRLLGLFDAEEQLFKAN
jgi:hypothetical protein